MIVTAWSPPDGALLASLLRSLAAAGGARLPRVHVLVPGPDAARAVRDLAGTLPVETVEAGFAEGPAPWDACLPVLPELLGRPTGVVTWLAPVVWVQERRAIAVMRDAAADGAIVAAYPIDRAYRALASEHSPWHVHRTALARIFGPEAVRRSWLRPALDIGVFSLAADAPHWAAWQEARAAAVRRGGTLGETPHTLSSLALNLAIRYRRLPVLPLPARWNWLCHLERPLWEGGRLVEPEPPYEAIAIFQLSGHAGQRTMTVYDRAGGRFRSNLRFPLRVEPVDPPRERPGMSGPA
ncbi:hypothetical protein [Stella sp.]|uniref:hypothetical protein n=1 Tax=Stella sp. TaxID=2912054 RepID=UPI0035B080B8